MNVNGATYVAVTIGPALPALSAAPEHTRVVCRMPLTLAVVLVPVAAVATPEWASVVLQTLVPPGPATVVTTGAVRSSWTVAVTDAALPAWSWTVPGTFVVPSAVMGAGAAGQPAA